jgi:hypothetical protein
MYISLGRRLEVEILPLIQISQIYSTDRLLWLHAVTKRPAQVLFARRKSRDTSRARGLKR